MPMRYLIAAALLIAGPAFADTDDGVTLTLENDAGMVTTVPGLTDRECNAITALLATRRTNGSGYLSLSSTSGVTLYATQPAAPHTSALTKTACVRATDQKK
jgi:hypothetical protein